MPDNAACQSPDQTIAGNTVMVSLDSGPARPPATEKNAAANANTNIGTTTPIRLARRITCHHCSQCRRRANRYNGIPSTSAAGYAYRAGERAARDNSGLQPSINRYGSLQRSTGVGGDMANATMARTMGSN